MDVSQTSYSTVLDENQSRYICYTRREDGSLCICLTDAADVWTSRHNEDSLRHFRQTFGLTSTEDFILKLKSACSNGEVSVVVSDSRAELNVAPGHLTVSLSRLDDTQATEELRQLLFRMADSLSQPDSGRSHSVSPGKNHITQRHPLDFEPRQQQNCAPSATVKRRLPGASLINPGAKKKLQATGVAFDDVDED